MICIDIYNAVPKLFVNNLYIWLMLRLSCYLAGPIKIDHCPKVAFIYVQGQHGHDLAKRAYV